MLLEQSNFSHLHRHPISDSVKTAVFVEVLVLEPIDEADDLYRKLGCGWLCVVDQAAACPARRHSLSVFKDRLLDTEQIRRTCLSRNKGEHPTFRYSRMKVNLFGQLLTFHGGFSGYGTLKSRVVK